MTKRRRNKRGKRHMDSYTCLGCKRTSFEDELFCPTPDCRFSKEGRRASR